MTRLNRKAFEALLPSFAAEYEQANLTLAKPRQRARDGKAKAKLETAQEKLF
jgi:hypothetical protein